MRSFLNYRSLIIGHQLSVMNFNYQLPINYRFNYCQIRTPPPLNSASSPPDLKTLMLSASDTILYQCGFNLGLNLHFLNEIPPPLNSAPFLFNFTPLFWKLPLCPIKMNFCMYNYFVMVFVMFAFFTQKNTFAFNSKFFVSQFI